MRNKRVQEMTTIAMFGAIIAIMAYVPQLGFISLFGVAAVTLIHIPVLIGGAYGGKRVSISLALTFGIFSFIIAWWRPVTPIDVLFRNPLVSIFPRFIFGIALWYLMVFFKKIFTNKALSFGFTFVSATFIHTMVTLIVLYIYGQSNADFIAITGGANVMVFLWAVLSTNGAVEMFLALVIATPIAMRLQMFNQPSEE